MSRARRLQVLALLLALAPLPAVFASDVSVMELLPGIDPGGCGRPISQITAYQTGIGENFYTFSNTTTWSASDYLFLELSVDGVRRTFVARLDIPARSSINVHVRFLRPVMPIGGVDCGNPPTGIVECPEPIVAVTTEEPKKKKE